MDYKKRIVALGFIDSAIAALAVVVAYVIRFDLAEVPKVFHLGMLVSYVVCTLIGIAVVKLYNRIWQYASIGEVVLIIKAMLIGEVLFYLLNLFVSVNAPQLFVPRSIYLMSMVLATAGICTSRLGWRILRASLFKDEDAESRERRVLIVGAGNAGVLVAKALLNAQTDMVPVAFVDDDPAKQRLKVVGLPIVGGREQIPEAVEQLLINNIVLTIPSASKEEISHILAICYRTSATVKILPSVSDMISRPSRQNPLEQIRDVSVEDLLGRDAVQLDPQGIAEYISERTVLVTGAGGSIGSEICRQVASFQPQKLLLLGHGENSIFEIDLELREGYPDMEIVPIIADIQNLQTIRNVFSKYEPDVVFHAAAHKHVTLMELNPLEAIKNNVLGTRNVAICAHEAGSSHFVMISSDKAVNPTSVMGATKRLAELVIRNLNGMSETKFSAVRFGNVLGSRGSVIPLFKRQIQKGGPVTVTHPDMVRYFMTIKEAVQLVLQAGAFARGGDIFILDMGKPVKIVDLAKDLIRLSGYQPGVDIQIAFTGARPGEKLNEELLTREEGITTTKHNSIFVTLLGESSLLSSEFVSVFEWMDQNPQHKETPEKIKELIFRYVSEHEQQRASASTHEIPSQMARG